MNVELALMAWGQGGVVTTEQASASGIGRRARRTLLKDGTLREVRLGILTAGLLWDEGDEHERHLIEIAAALLIRGCAPGTRPASPLVAGRGSAGFLHGLPLPQGIRDGRQPRWDPDQPPPWERRPDHVDLVSADRRNRSYRAGVEVRPADLPPAHVVLQGLIPVTGLARTAVDLMREGTRGEATMVADVAMRLGVARAELEAAVAHAHQWPGSLVAREAVAFADPLAESPAESLARRVCADHGLLDFELQVSFFGGSARVDLLFRAFRVVLEVDGAIKYTDPWCGSARDTQERERAREERLRAAGWTVVRTTWSELLYEPERLIARLKAAFADAAAA